MNSESLPGDSPTNEKSISPSQLEMDPDLEVNQKPPPIMRDASRHSLTAEMDQLWQHPDAAAGTMSVEQEAKMLTDLMYKKYVGDGDGDDTGNENLDTQGKSAEDEAAEERRATAADLHRSLELLNKRMDEQLIMFDQRARRGSFTGNTRIEEETEEEERESSPESPHQLTPREKRDAKRRRNKTLDNPLDKETLEIIRTPSQKLTPGKTRRDTKDTLSPNVDNNSSRSHFVSLGHDEDDQMLMTTPLSKFNGQRRAKTDEDIPRSKVTFFPFETASNNNNNDNNNNNNNNNTNTNSNHRESRGRTNERGREPNWGKAPRTTSFGYIPSGFNTDTEDSFDTNSTRKLYERPTRVREAHSTPRRRARSQSPRRKKLPHRPISRREAREAMTSVMRDATPIKHQFPTPRPLPQQPPQAQVVSSTPIRSTSIPGVIESPEKSPIKQQQQQQQQAMVSTLTLDDYSDAPLIDVSLSARSPSNGWVDESTVLETPKQILPQSATKRSGPLRGELIHMDTHDLPLSAPLASAALNESMQSTKSSSTKSAKKAKRRPWRRGKEKLHKFMIGLPNEFVHVSHTAPEDVGQLMSSLESAGHTSTLHAPRSSTSTSTSTA